MTNDDPMEELRGRQVASLCKHLASGGHADKWYTVDGNPSHGTVWEWRRRRADWSEQIEEARRTGAHVLVDQAVAIADGSHAIAQGEEQYPGQRKTQVWARFEAAKRLNPVRYGDKVDVTSGGKPIGNADKAVAAQEMAAILANAAQAIERGER